MDIVNSTTSFRKTLTSFLVGVIIVRVVNISVRAIAKKITTQIDIRDQKNSAQPVAGNLKRCEDDSYIVYVEIFILVIILLITYLYGL